MDLSWKLFPAVKVSVDSRYEVAYPEDWVRQTLQFYAAEQDWQETLTAYPTDLVLVPQISPVARVIQQSGWHEVYLDREFEIFARPRLDLPFSNQSSQSFTASSRKSRISGQFHLSLRRSLDAICGHFLPVLPTAGTHVPELSQGKAGNSGEASDSSPVSRAQHEFQ